MPPLPKQYLMFPSSPIIVVVVSSPIFSFVLILYLYIHTSPPVLL